MVLIWLTGGLILLAGMLLTYLLKSRKASAIPFRVHLHGNRRVLRLIRRLLRCKQPYIRTLQASSTVLMSAIRQMNRRIASLPALPADSDGEPRLMNIAQEVADNDDINGETLLKSLSDNDFTSLEVLIFPLCVACAQSYRLSAVLTAMLADMHQAKQARQTLRQLQRSKQPEQLLKKCTLNSFGLSILFRSLEECASEALLNRLKNWLSEMEVTPTDLANAAARRLERYDAEIRRAQDCYSALERLDWSNLCSAVDSVHKLLLSDPAGFYPRLERNAQLQLRLDVDTLSRRTSLPPAELIRRAFILCAQTSESCLESCISYYFQDGQGLPTLHRSLPTQRGRLYAHLKEKGELFRYIGTWCVALVTGFAFLQSGQPVILLPFFLILVGHVLRHPGRIVKRCMPGMQLVHADSALRTLVFIHANLSEPQDALSAAKRLKSSMCSLHGEPADFLLIGDFAPCITAVSGFDYSVMQAANSAVTALDDSRVAYIQRGRAWDDAAHCYCARGGHRGAITEICRLIATGESLDSLAYSTVVPASMERRYAYILVLGNDIKPLPGLLTRFLSVMSHPLCQAHSTPQGLRGHALLLPEGFDTFDGTGFIRPDAYLEAVDGRLHDHHPAPALCGELAGQISVDGAQVFQPKSPFSWESQYHHTCRAWQLFPWQLPIVSTPSGWIDNPLSFFQRYHLRELLRPSLVPLSQAFVLLWGLLTANWPLMFLSLLLPELGTELHSRKYFLSILCLIALLPTRVAVNIAAAVQLLRRKSHLPPDFTVLEAWTQGLTATLMASLVFLLPAGGSAAFILAVTFACFPLAHRFMNT